MPRTRKKISRSHKIIFSAAGIIALAALIIWATFVFTSEKINLANQYIEKNHNFSIKYPTGWTYTEPRPATVVFKGKTSTPGTPESKMTVIVGLVTFKNRSGIYQNVQSYINFIKTFFQKVNVKPTTLEEGPIDLAQTNGKILSGRYVALRYTYNNKQFIEYEILLDKKDNHTFYIFGYNAPITEYEAGLPIFKAMLRTFNTQ